MFSLLSSDVAGWFWVTIHFTMEFFSVCDSGGFKKENQEAKKYYLCR